MHLSTPSEAIIYEDDKVSVCLASHPKTRGHCIVGWKEDVADLRYLSHEEYSYLLQMVDIARDALLKVLQVEKVYLVYMDEVNQVHWHLIPRYNKKGFDVLCGDTEEVDFSLVKDVKAVFTEVRRIYQKAA